jgi:hypothetical protein
MTLCPNDGNTLAALPKTGLGTYYVCNSGCGNFFYGTGGLLMRSPYITGGQAVLSAASSPTVTVSHGLNVKPDAGDVVLTLGNALNSVMSGSQIYISAYSSQNFVITTNVPGAVTSGVAINWKFSKI